jgi:hypothetical protein
MCYLTRTIVSSSLTDIEQEISLCIEDALKLYMATTNFAKVDSFAYPVF